MEYCCTKEQLKGTCYHQFQKGKFDGSFWKKDSLYIHDKYLVKLHVIDLFRTVIPYYNEYGETVVTRDQWNIIYLRASAIGGKVKIVVDEMNSWAETAFDTDEIFTVMGI